MLTKYINIYANVDLTASYGTNRIVHKCDYTKLLTLKDITYSDILNNTDKFYTLIAKTIENLFIGSRELAVSRKTFVDVFMYSQLLVKINVKGSKYIITRGIIMDNNFNILLAIMTRKNILEGIDASNRRLLWQRLIDIKDLIVFVNRSFYTVKRTKSDIVMNFMKNVIMNSMENNIEVRVVDKISCFTVPEVYTTDIGNPISIDIIKEINVV